MTTIPTASQPGTFTATGFEPTGPATLTVDGLTFGACELIADALDREIERLEARALTLAKQHDGARGMSDEARGNAVRLCVARANAAKFRALSK